ncbi:DNA-processing protein DprA [Patescibacteria group bacterium]|nr:DNA-processing protein DprA [Patescibacteria group bacterium]
MNKMQNTKSVEIRKLSPNKFPERLREIADPPKQLYVRGALPPSEYKYLCVVGARRFSEYGREAVQKLLAGLRGYPVVIVSGLALGIDSIAHRAALDNGLTTIAVPGSGLSPNVLYPGSHAALAEKIIASGGALVSEFEPDFRATSWSFPQRNRIMAGLSDAVLVVESEIKSGTLITARLAGEYNRDVLTVPGSIFAKNSTGPHMLLRLGATPVTNNTELLDALGFKEAEQKKTALPDYSDCSPEEKRVLNLLTEAVSRDELIRSLKLPVNEANVILGAMELKGLIKETLGEIHVA